MIFQNKIVTCIHTLNKIKSGRVLQNKFAISIHTPYKIKSARVLQNKIVISIHTLNKIKSARVLQNKIVTSIHCNLFIHETGVPRCAIYIHCNLFILIHIHCNLFNQKKVFDRLTSVCRRQRLPCTCGREAAGEEEDASSSDVDNGGGD
jgi:hypothetical protein